MTKWFTNDGHVDVLSEEDVEGEDGEELKVRRPVPHTPSSKMGVVHSHSPKGFRKVC